MTTLDVTQVVIALGVIFSSYQSFSNHYKLVRVQEQTNGLSAHLVKLTRESSYARGLKKGKNARGIRKDKE